MRKVADKITKEQAEELAREANERLHAIRDDRQSPSRRQRERIMTRDEAIKAILDVLLKSELYRSASPHRRWMAAACEVDALIALGVLKLDAESAVSVDGKVRHYVTDADLELRKFDDKGMPAASVDAPMPPVKPPKTSLYVMCYPGVPKEWHVKPEDLPSIVTDEEAPARCEPPPEHRGKRWHWLRDPAGPNIVFEWSDDRWWRNARWWPQHEMATAGWRYVTPCEEPRQKLSGWVRLRRDVTGDRGGHPYRWPKGTLGEVIADRDDGWVALRLSGEAGTRLFDRDSIEPCEGPKS